MLKKFASDALGLSDIGKIIEPEDYDKTDADDYVRHEDNEEIFFLIMTKSDEYCFTNLALIHVDGENATSSKRTMKRYPYAHHQIADVLLETAGKIDMDIEIKFTMGTEVFDIDVYKEEIEKLKDLYKALLFMAEDMIENNKKWDMAQQSMAESVKILQHSRAQEAKLSDEHAALTEYSFSWLASAYDKYHVKDYGDVFKKYIQN